MTELDEKLEKKFRDLPDDWKDGISGMSRDEIKSAIAKLVHNENENQKAKEEDQDLAEKKEQYQTAQAGYKEATKYNKLKVKFALRVLSDKGGI